MSAEVHARDEHRRFESDDRARDRRASQYREDQEDRERRAYWARQRAREDYYQERRYDRPRDEHGRFEPDDRDRLRPYGAQERPREDCGRFAPEHDDDRRFRRDRDDDHYGDRDAWDEERGRFARDRWDEERGRRDDDRFRRSPRY